MTTEREIVRFLADDGVTWVHLGREIERLSATEMRVMCWMRVQTADGPGNDWTVIDPRTADGLLRALRADARWKERGSWRTNGASSG